MIRTDSTTPDSTGSSTVKPALSAAATPEQAAALYEEQVRAAAAHADPLLGVNFVALQAEDIFSLDAVTRKAKPSAV